MAAIFALPIGSSHRFRRSYLDFLFLALVVFLVFLSLFRQASRSGPGYLPLRGVDARVAALKVGRHRGCWLTCRYVYTRSRRVLSALLLYID